MSCYDFSLTELIVEAGAVNAEPSGFTHRIAIVDWGEAHPEFVQFLIQRGARPPQPRPDESAEKSSGEPTAGRPLPASARAE